VAGAKSAGWFVKDDVNLVFGLQRTGVQRHPVGQRIHLGAEFRDDTVVDGDAALFDELLAGPTGTDAGLR
jgi:hypothetical protein